MNEHELHEERHVVTGVKSMPDGEKQKRRDVRNVSVVEELEALVDVLEHPHVGLNVEGRNVIAERVSVFEDAQFDVGTSTPIFLASLLVTRHKSEACDKQQSLVWGSQINIELDLILPQQIAAPSLKIQHEMYL